MSKTARNSYLICFAVLILVGWSGLATPFITVFFSYFALTKLSFTGRKWLTLVLFLTLVTGIGFGLVFFVHEGLTTLPQVATTSIPKAIDFAKKHNLELPFSDWDSLKDFAQDTVKASLPYLSTPARKAVKQFVFMLIGVVVAMSLYWNPKIDLNEVRTRGNLYTVLSGAMADRVRTFYRSFATVMGAQLVISTINTGFTAIFITCVGLRYPGLVIATTFLCGLLPIVGNLISNSIIVCIGFLVSPQVALAALIFLVALHKFEYFLNSKVVGERIKNPVWLTLIGLIVGEKLMGIPGMILAPVILHYLKIEAYRIPAGEPTPTSNCVTEEDEVGAIGTRL